MKGYIFLLGMLLFLFACHTPSTQNAQGSWITGTEQEQINSIEKQFRGFDMAMVETGYRYQELYWAGQDQNWEYAQYQLKKLTLAIQNGLERRPKRAASAQYFLQTVVPSMAKVIADKDSSQFNAKFQFFTTHCNSCHAMEKVPFFTVKTPRQRPSPIQQ